MSAVPTPIAGSVLRTLNPVETGYSDGEWLPGVFGTGTLSSLTADNGFAHILALPSINAGRSLIQRTRPGIELSLMFLGVGANNDTYTGKIWGLKGLPPVATDQFNATKRIEFFGTHLGSFTATLGAAVTHADSLHYPTQMRFADAVAFSPDNTITPGILDVGDSADCGIIKVFDKAPAFSHFIIEFLAGGTTTAWGYRYVA